LKTFGGRGRTTAFGVEAPEIVEGLIAIGTKLASLFIGSNRCRRIAFFELEGEIELLISCAKVLGHRRIRLGVIGCTAQRNGVGV